MASTSGNFSPEPLRSRIMPKSPRQSQVARKSTGGLPPNKMSEKEKPLVSSDLLWCFFSSGSSDLSVTKSASETTGHSTPRAPLPIRPGCGICNLPLRIYPAENPVHHFITPCQHPFHHVCYLNFLTTAPRNERTQCPTCHASCKHCLPPAWFLLINIWCSVGGRRILPEYYLQRRTFPVCAARM